MPRGVRDRLGTLFSLVLLFLFMNRSDTLRPSFESLSLVEVRLLRGDTNFFAARDTRTERPPPSLPIVVVVVVVARVWDR